MKKILLVLGLGIMASCGKEGVVYKFNYKADITQSYTITNFFVREYRDDKAALEWYKTTEAWELIKNDCDTFWIEYYGTYEEWK